MSDEKDFEERLKNMKTEDIVKMLPNLGAKTTPKHKKALREIELRKDKETQQKNRELIGLSKAGLMHQEEANQIAREANQISKKSLCMAKVAIMISIISLIASLINWFFKTA